MDTVEIAMAIALSTIILAIGLAFAYAHFMDIN